MLRWSVFQQSVLFDLDNLVKYLETNTCRMYSKSCP